MVFFEKSQPAPTCLVTEKTKSSGDYKCGDVLRRLKDDFNNKCYICEQKDLTSINVEHFRPHENKNIDLKFDWNNLFWSCGHCNNIKSNNYKDLINCTDEEENVESRIKLSMRPFPKEIVKVECLDAISSTQSTADLLLKVYNGTTQLKTFESASIRNEILNEIIDFQKWLKEYFDDGFDAEYKIYVIANIRKHLSRSSKFAAFKRWIVRDNPILHDELGEYID